MFRKTNIKIDNNFVYEFELIFNLKIWLITDTHFNHKNIIKYENRPENFKELIIENWKKSVPKYDIVLHLGDVIFSKQSEITEILNNLPGFKYLIKGNHDYNKDKWYYNHGFNGVMKYFKYKDILFSHIPIDIKNIKGIKYNIHGHFHNNLSQEDIKNKFPFYSDKHKHLSIEEENYKLIRLEDFFEKKYKMSFV